jgi:hypothetical protein
MNFWTGFKKQADGATKGELKELLDKHEARETFEQEDQESDEEQELERKAGVEKHASFLDGFTKRAEMAEDVSPIMKFNAQGGVDPMSPEAMQRAQAADLVTLPSDVEGANCGNCSFVRILDKKMKKGFCTNPEMLLDVTPRMCCSLWDAPGVVRAWEQRDQEMASQSVESMDEGMNPTQPAIDEKGKPVLDAQGLPGVEDVEQSAPPPEEKKPKAKPKPKPAEAKGVTVNVHK